MTRIPPAEMTGPYAALMKRMARKMLGEVPDALGVGWHQRQVLTAGFSLGRKAKKWNACDESLKAFAHMAVSSLVGCSFCLDLGYYTVHHDGLDLTKARDVPRWRESTVFTPLERDVLAYAEAMTQTPPTVTDEMSTRLLDALGAPALVELTAFIAFANFAARNNAAAGVESAGLAARCNLAPLALATTR